MFTVATPAATLVPFTPCTVTVNVCCVPTLFVSVGGLISIQASTHFFSAFGSGCPADVSLTTVPVVRVRPGWASTEIAEEACTTEVPVTAEVMMTVQDESVAPPG